jgi:peroxiredoxin Q/BCP
MKLLGGNHMKRTFFQVCGIAVCGVACLIAAFAETPRALPVGDKAPAIELPDQSGKIRKPLNNHHKVKLIAFYPADMTQGCTIEAHSLTAAQADLRGLGVASYGVSVQDSNSHQQFCTKEGITYTLLADTEKEVSKAYGVLSDDGKVATRVTFIIGKDDNIAYVDKDVNSHIITCGKDWADWLRAHPEVSGKVTD